MSTMVISTTDQPDVLRTAGVFTPKREPRLRVPQWGISCASPIWTRSGRCLCLSSFPAALLCGRAQSLQQILFKLIFDICRDHRDFINASLLSQSSFKSGSSQHLITLFSVNLALCNVCHLIKQVVQAFHQRVQGRIRLRHRIQSIRNACQQCICGELRASNLPLKAGNMKLKFILIDLAEAQLKPCKQLRMKAPAALFGRCLNARLEVIRHSKWIAGSLVSVCGHP